jgi:shikimate kinase
MTDTFRSSETVSEADPSKPHIVLVGLPGAGKTTVGKLLGERLTRTFLDFDAEIERREGKPIAQIFGEQGEAGFRALERKLTEEVKALGNMVLAPGGGWVTDPATVALIRPPAILFYLRVRPETALKRLSTAVGSRPLLSRPDPQAELKKLFEARKAQYEGSDFEIGAELLTPEQVTAEIVAKMRGSSPGAWSGVSPR